MLKFLVVLALGQFGQPVEPSVMAVVRTPSETLRVTIQPAMLPLMPADKSVVYYNKAGDTFAGEVVKLLKVRGSMTGSSSAYIEVDGNWKGKPASAHVRILEEPPSSANPLPSTSFTFDVIVNGSYVTSNHSERNGEGIPQIMTLGSGGGMSVPLKPADEIAMLKSQITTSTAAIESANKRIAAIKEEAAKVAGSK